ncbi:MAG: YidC/Oxa1 family membrane protein insertase [Agathobacter sp.]
MLATVLSQNAGKILGPLAALLGKAMNGIYMLLSRAGIENVALTIIIFTICVYMCLLPLTIKQQKFSKMSQVMQPELQAIQKKYKNKRDQVSVQKMNEETQEVYKKYGVSPSGSCLQLVIQLPILFALYRVIYNVPGYIQSIKNIFTDSVAGIMATDGFQKTMGSFYEAAREGNYVMKNIRVDFTGGEAADIPNYIIDVLYRCTSENWLQLQNLFPNAADALAAAQTKIDQVNNFLGVSVVYSPKNIIATSFHEGNFIFILIGILIPVLSLATQFLNIRLMPQAASSGGDNSMAGQMKMMNYMMPIYSFILVFFLPVGLGVYWIAGAVIRCIQQFIINRHLSRMDMDKLIAKNMEKAKQKEEKRATKKNTVSGATIANNASMRTKTMASKANTGNHSSNSSKNDQKAQPSKKYKEGSLASKANMVNSYNNKNNK